MAKSKKKCRPEEEALPDPADKLAAYWEEQVRMLGRNIMFVDSGAILSCLTPGEDRFKKFFKELIGDRLVTSTYVVAETVRRLVKSRPGEFKGPGGEQQTKLAIFYLTTWLEEYEVQVMCVPEDVFGVARNAFVSQFRVACDLNDLLSYVIVKGLQQGRIASSDQHFQQLGLTCLP